MDNPTSFGSWLKVRRKQLDLTQTALADQVGCTAATIRKIEAEERRPSQQLAELLAECLQIPAEQKLLFLQVARGGRGPGQLGRVPAVPTVELPLENLLPSRRIALPMPPTPLVGREKELLTVTQLLGEQNCRLLTLIGPGGIGKTRLALETAVQIQSAFDYGAAFVSLASLAGREQLITAIADSLGFILYAASDRAEQLFHYLLDKSVLLLLDNIEHLSGDEASIGFVSDLLNRASDVKLLITSREPLHLQTEWVYAVPGLPLPEGEGLDELRSNSAIQLFIQRAERARAGFNLSTENSPSVTKICQIVEGLPLGIELAAAWVLTLSCEEIVAELEKDLDFLAAPTRDLAERHRSLAAVFNHSWKLLSTEEQRVLRQLAVFQGGFDREAAEFVAGSSLAMLSNLVSKSLLRRTDTKTGRYDLHDLVRKYGLDKLHQVPEEYFTTARRHCFYYSGLLEQRGAALKGAERTAVVAELIRDIANLRQAWNWASTHNLATALNQGADTLFWLYESRSNCREGVPLFGQAIDGLGRWIEISGNQGGHGDYLLALGKALNYQGFFRFRQGQHPQGRELLQRSLTILQSLPDADTKEAQAAISDATAFLGTVTSAMGEYTDGHRLLQEGLFMKRALEDRWGAAFCLRQLGLSAYYLGEYAEAYRLLSESLTISQEMGNSWAIASSLNMLSLAASAQGNYSEAEKLLGEGLAYSRMLEDRYNVAVSLNGLGMVSQAAGNSLRAKHFYEESIAIWREIGDDGDLAVALNNLGHCLLAEGKMAEAEPLFQEALKISRETAVWPVALEAMLGLATLRAETDGYLSVLPMVANILQHPSCSPETRKRANSLWGDLALHLDQKVVLSIREAAERRMPEEIVTELLLDLTF